MICSLIQYLRFYLAQTDTYISLWSESITKNFGDKIVWFLPCSLCWYRHCGPAAWQPLRCFYLQQHSEELYFYWCPWHLDQRHGLIKRPCIRHFDTGKPVGILPVKLLDTWEIQDKYAIGFTTYWRGTEIKSLLFSISIKPISCLNCWLLFTVLLSLSRMSMSHFKFSSRRLTTSG